MEVILLEKIRHLGAIGDKVKVKAGYGRNYLIPKTKAVFATPDNIAKFEVRRAELERAAERRLDTAEARKQSLVALQVVTISAKAGDEGKLFGSIGTRDIAAAITKAGVEVTKNEISLSSGSIRQVGQFDINIELHSDVTATLKIQVVKEA